MLRFFMPIMVETCYKGQKKERGVHRLNQSTLQQIPEKSADDLKLLLGQCQGFYQPIFFDTLASTNETAKDLAAQGAPEGTVVIAEHQTAGKGRMNRSFFSPRGTGIYMSLILRPNLLAKQALWMTTAAATAVAEAIETLTGKSTLIKWVNDVFCGGKKVCGILTEGTWNMEDGQLEYAILGIGINVAEPEDGFPNALQSIAGAVSDNPDPSFRIRLMANVLERFWSDYTHLPDRAYLSRYQSKSLLQGKSVSVLRGDQSRRAYAGEIDEDFRLFVRYENGETEWLSSGEVSIRSDSVE